MTVELILASTPVIIVIICILSLYFYLRQHIAVQVTNELTDNQSFDLPSINVNEIYGWISVMVMITFIASVLFISVERTGTRQHERSQEANMVDLDDIDEEVLIKHFIDLIDK